MNPTAHDLYWIKRDLLEWGNLVGVRWPLVIGGQTDPGSGARTGGTAYVLSGTLRAHVHEEPARSVERRFAEIKVGDLILDCAPAALVSVTPGQYLNSGTVPLDDLDGPVFIWRSREYTQKQMSQELAEVWDHSERGESFERVVFLERRR